MNQDTFIRRIARQGTIVVSIGILLIIVTLVVPLPPVVLDILLTFNISFSFLLIIATMYIKRPLELASFPSILLMATLFRLALNVSTTRAILLWAYAGNVIDAFGRFVVGGNYVVGGVIFLIIIIIQFIVITAGANRIAEVAARFTLDAMPGKQMSIDADLNAGLITEQEAKERRDEIRREADFYGAMDGAAKFIRGDAIAGLIITAINIIGGLAIGIFQRKMPLPTAAATYIILTIGDGLVAQIPAVIVSTAAGIIVTRAAAEADLGRDVITQMLVHPRALFIVAIILFLCAFTGLPFIPFILLSAIIGGIGYLLQKSQKIEKQSTSPTPVKKETEDWSKIIQVDPLEIEIGYGLINLVEPEKGGDLLNKITNIRKRIGEELGFLTPPIRIRDNLELRPEEYVIKVKGAEVARGEVYLDLYLAMSPITVKEKIEGIETKEPIFGLPALWIEEKNKPKAESLGYTVVNASAVIITHLQEIIKRHAAEILDRQEVQKIIDSVRETHSTVVNELIPNIMKVGDVQKVLQNLLKEGIPIKDMVTILETLADAAPIIKDIDTLTELVRQALKRSISQKYQEYKKINCITINPKVEELIMEGVQGETIVVDPKIIQQLFKEISKSVEKLVKKNYQPIIMCSPRVRKYLRKIIEPVLPNLIILSYGEIASGVELNSVAEITLEEVK